MPNIILISVCFFPAESFHHLLAFLFHCCRLYFPVFFTFPDLCRKDSLSFLSLPLHLCLRSKHADDFNTCKEKEMFQKKKRSFIWLCHRISFSLSEHFQGEKVVCKCHLYFRGKSDWHHSGLLIIRAGQRQQPGVTNSLCLWVGGMSKLKTTGISCIWLLGCGVVGRAASS